MHPSSNFQTAAQYIARAASQGAQLAVLPEYHLTNWVPEDPGFVELCAQWTSYLEKYCALAKKHKICIVPGTIVELCREEEKEEEEKLVNVAYFIDDEGEVLGRHPERDHLTSSTHDPHTVIQTPLGPVGLLICWDLAFPEAFRELIAQGAKMIIIPTFWTLSDCGDAGLALNPMAEKLFLTSALTLRAFENTCAVIFVNAAGPPSDTPSKHYMGLSRVTLPFVGPLGDATKDSDREGMSVVEIDMEVVEEAERNYGVRGDMAGRNWHYEYRHGRTDGKDGKGKL
ncbi:hypothetical protein MMC07_003393 [Pseudocyphellaria aurata]|nr:hypothetical protein [Pseudocyphellaria aurata]